MIIMYVSTDWWKRKKSPTACIEVVDWKSARLKDHAEADRGQHEVFEKGVHAWGGVIKTIMALCKLGCRASV